MIKSLRQLEIEWGNSKCGRSSEQFIYDYFMNVIPTTKLAHYALLQEENELLRYEVEALREQVETFKKERKSINIDKWFKGIVPKDKIRAAIPTFTALEVLKLLVRYEKETPRRRS